MGGKPVQRSDRVYRGISLLEIFYYFVNRLLYVITFLKVSQTKTCFLWRLEVFLKCLDLNIKLFRLKKFYFVQRISSVYAWCYC